MGASQARGGLDLGAGPVSIALAILIIGFVIFEPHPRQVGNTQETSRLRVTAPSAQELMDRFAVPRFINGETVKRSFRLPVFR